MNPFRFFRPIYLQGWLHLKSVLKESVYRRYWCLEASLGNRRKGLLKQAKIGQWLIEIPDSPSFLSTYREIFVENIYRFSFKNNSPRILDLGANIGLSVLYFKQLFPAAVITAFEADPQIFSYLKRNIVGNGFDDVRLINAAAWVSPGSLRFFPDGADGGRVGEDGPGIEVASVDIRDYLQGIDFLKMDIEGAEQVIIPACKGLLQHISYIFVEYHSRPQEPQKLAEIMTVLQESGFRVHIHSHNDRPAPLYNNVDSSGFDMQLNIFGWKE